MRKNMSSKSHSSLDKQGGDAAITPSRYALSISTNAKGCLSRKNLRLRMRFRSSSTSMSVKYVPGYRRSVLSWVTLRRPPHWIVMNRPCELRCVSAYVHVCTYVHTTQTHTHNYIRIICKPHTHTRTHTHSHTQHRRVHAHAHTHTHTHIQATTTFNMTTHTHTHTLTYTQTRTIKTFHISTNSLFMVNNCVS
jgi:hypothetical protein